MVKVLLNQKKKNFSSSTILSSCCNRQPSERLSPKRGPGGTGFQVQNGMLWLELTPYTLLWDSSTRRPIGRRRHRFFSSPLKPSPTLCWLVARPALDVPLHVKSQMVRPGETSVTVTAFKWLCPSVLPEVSGQLVASCKTPLTALP